MGWARWKTRSADRTTKPVRPTYARAYAITGRSVPSIWTRKPARTCGR